MKEPKIKYFIYARKSQESDERQVQSIDDQIAICEKIASLYGLEVVEVLRESKSAKTPFNRAIFSDMLQRIKKKEATGIITWKLDRLGRNQLESGMVGQMLEDKEIEVIQVPEKTYRPEDNVVIYSIETAMATQYSKDLSKNVRRGQGGKITRGWYPGAQPPMGYLIDRNSSGKEIIADPERFDTLRRAWDLMLTGLYSPQQVRDKLNKEWGFTTLKRGKKGGCEISLSNMYKFFGNIFYTGSHFIWNGVLYADAKHPAMVSMEEFEQVQQILNKSDRPRTHKHEYPYKGVFHCDCGCSITAYVKKEKYNFYKCTKRKVGISCDAKQTSERKLEEKLITQVKELAIHPQFLEWAFKAIDDCAESERKTDNDITATRGKTIIDKKGEIQNWNGMLAKGFVEESEYLSAKEELIKEIAQLESEGQAEVDVIEKKEELKDVFTFMSRIINILEGDDSEKKRQVMFALGDGHTLVDTVPVLNLHSFIEKVRTSYPNIVNEYHNVRTQKGGQVATSFEDLETINLLWCGWGESNSRPLLGRQLLYHLTTPALFLFHSKLYSGFLLCLPDQAIVLINYWHLTTLIDIKYLFVRKSISKKKRGSTSNKIFTYY